MRNWTIENIKRGTRNYDSRRYWPTDANERPHISEKKRLLTIILCLCFGIFGAHRFYTGKTKSAGIMLCTLGGLGIWHIIDSVIVIFGEFADNEGKNVKDWV